MTQGQIRDHHLFASSGTSTVTIHLLREPESSAFTVIVTDAESMVIHGVFPVPTPKKGNTWRVKTPGLELSLGMVISLVDHDGAIVARTPVELAHGRPRLPLPDHHLGGWYRKGDPTNPPRLPEV